MDPWKWDYSKTFARFLSRVPYPRRLSSSPFLPDRSTPFVAIHSSSRIMTRRVYGSSAAAFTEARPARASPPFVLSSFAGFNCCANICAAGASIHAGANTITVQGKVHLDFIFIHPPPYRPLNPPVNFGTNDRPRAKLEVSDFYFQDLSLVKSNNN